MGWIIGIPWREVGRYSRSFPVQWEMLDGLATGMFSAKRNFVFGFWFVFHFLFQVLVLISMQWWVLVWRPWVSH